MNDGRPARPRRREGSRLYPVLASHFVASTIEGAEELKRMLAAIILSTRNNELKENEPVNFNP